MAVEQRPARVRLTTALRDGLPLGVIAVVAIVALVVILVQADNRAPTARGFAEFRATADGCRVDQDRSFNATTCEVVGSRDVVVRFTSTLGDTTPIASAGACCEGDVSASVTGDREVRVVVPPIGGAPVRASVLLP
jgi:hypothetical protein